MTRFRIAIFATAFMLAVVPCLYAAVYAPAHEPYRRQQPSQTKPQAQQPQAQKPSQAQAAQLSAKLLIRAKNLINKSVHDVSGQKLGTIKTLAVDTHRGQIAFAILQLGSWIGQGADDLYAVPFAAIKSAPDQKYVTLKITKAQLKNAKGFSKTTYPNMNSRTWAEQTDRQYGYPPYWQSDYQTESHSQTAQPQQPASVAPSQWLKQQGLNEDQIHQLQSQGFPHNQVQQDLEKAYENSGLSKQQAQERARQMSEQFQHMRTLQQHAEQTSKAIREQAQANQPSGHAEQAPMQQGENNLAGQAARTYQPTIERMADLLGITVQNPKHQKLGTLKDLVIDTREGRIAYAVVEHGGVLGIGSKLAAVPYSAIKLLPGRKVASLDTNSATLNRVSFKPSNWPDLQSEQWAAQIHREFNQQPYWQVYGYGFYTTPKTTQFVGNITKVQQLPQQRMQVEVQTPSGQAYQVDLGPKSFLEQHNLKITRGQSIQITGFSVEQQGQAVIKAQKVMQDSQSVELRNAQGEPIWNQPKPQQRAQPSQKNQQP